MGRWCMGFKRAVLISHTIEDALHREVQIRANQLLIDCPFDLTFYKSEDTDKLISYYRNLSTQGKVSTLVSLSTEDGTMVAFYGSKPDTMDIVLRNDQDLTSFSFQALKVLVWYKYYHKLEETYEKQIRCLVKDPQAYELAVTNTFDSMNEMIEALAIYFTAIIQELALLNSQIIPKEDKNG
jgi:hypothetical protein